MIGFIRTAFPKIAAITALGITLATQGWGSALATSIGLTGASSAALTAGISSVAAQGGLSLMRNNLDPLATLKDVTQKDALLSTLESMAVGGALSGVTQAQNLSGHVTKAAVKAAVHAGFQGVQGQPVNIQDIFKDVTVNTLSGVAANTIGDAYGSGGIDPVTHKVLHGVVGGLSGAALNGSQGATSGALSAMIAETLADLVTPQAEVIAQTLAAQNLSDEAFDQARDTYINDQHNLILFTTASIMAGLGQDVDTAINAADNALTHNNGGILKALFEVAKVGIKAFRSLGKGVWKKGPVVRGEIIEKKLGQNLHQNFPTVDKFKDGIVTSIKSVDLKAKTYQNTTKLRHTLTKYVDKVAKFDGGKVGKTDIIKPNQITGRSLDIAIPKGANAAQKQIMKEVVDYGLTKDVMVNIVKIK